MPARDRQYEPSLATEVQYGHAAGPLSDAIHHVTERQAVTDESPAGLVPEQLLHAALDSLQESFFIFEAVRDDRDVVVDLRYRFLNAAAARMYGRPAMDVVGHGLRELFSSVDDLGIFASYIEPLVTGQPTSMRVPEFDENGVRGAFDVAACPFGDGVVVTAHDVTEEVRAFRALTESEARFRLLAENASDVVLQLAPNGLCLWASPSVRDMLGWEPCQLVGRGGLEFTHPEDRGSMKAAIKQWDSGETRAAEYRLRTADGRYVWVSAVSSAICDGDGRFTGRVIGLRGIDEEVWQRAELAESEELFRLAMDNSGAGMCLVSPEGRFVRVNEALCAFLGRSREELRSVTWPDVTHPDELAEDRPLVESVLLGRRESFRRRKRYLRPDGAVVWGDLVVGAVRNSDGSARYLVVQIIDATEQVLAEAELADREELLRVVLDNSRDGTATYGTDLRFEYVNRRITELSGIPAEAWVGKTMDELGYSAADTDFWSAHVRGVFATGEPDTMEYEIDNTEGHQWYEASLSPKVAADGRVTHVVSTNRQITARVLAEQRLRDLATHDPLTGLANRAAVLDEISRGLTASRRSGQPMGVLLLDLDRFKFVNDSLGHGAGDQLLLAAADRISETVRGGDLVGRLGGDEFVIVMRGLGDPAEAVQAALRLVEAFRLPFDMVKAELFSTASVGVTVATGVGQAEDLVREADTAMYVAKSEGRDRLSVFNEDLRAAVTARLAMEGDLRRALQRGELAVWYQPEVDLATGCVIAVEALLRWRHPSGESLAADRFIELAEETGLILDIGPWVLQEACVQAQRWATERPDRPIIVRVNVSALQLADDGLLDTLDAALLASGLSPRTLCMEITETALLRDTQVVRANFAGIRQRGVRVAIDDFGTGYASLAYLRQYPVDVLKIDRSFVVDVTTDDHDRRLVAGIVSLSESLGMTVTAEGVETPEQAATLRDLGCPGAQGFLYSQAVCADQLTALLDKEFPHP